MKQMDKHTEINDTKQESHTARNIVVVIFSIIEVILAFRLVFKLLGANPNNFFVNAIYAITQFFVGIFEGIFPRAATSGMVFEPATLIAIIVVALIAWIITKLMSPRISTVFGESVVIDGSVFSKHAIKVDGGIHGSVKTKANLFIGPNSVIGGDIQGKDITICGKVSGNVTAKGRIIITSKAQISGNMSMEQLVVDEGAVFNGNCSMQLNQKPEKET